MVSLQLQHLEVKTQRRLVLRTVLIEGINCRLLHLSKILQPSRAPKQNVVVVEAVSYVLKKLHILGFHHSSLLTIPIAAPTAVIGHVLE